MQALAGDRRVVVLGTGGTIAGVALRADRVAGYRAAALGVQSLVDAVPALSGMALEAEQVSQVDSKDMTPEIWQTLAARCLHHLGRPDVAGIVVTHGTDTLEETAWFLERVVAPSRPVVLTASMRPATSMSADGPLNLFEAVVAARIAALHGVNAALGGRVIAAGDVRKVHGWRLDAFGAGDGSPLAIFEDGTPRLLRERPPARRHPGADRALVEPPRHWPAVDIVTSHAGARGATIDALVAAGARGIVIAGTGNGTAHASLEEAARRAMARGVQVRRASRCTLGGVIGTGDGRLPSYGGLTPAQAVVELRLDLLALPD
ncbi:MAG: asparaginase [Rubrivivax sp.]|nr:asparaginase [Rubrivivax sp.]